MRDELTIMRLIPGERQEVFGYFVTPHLLEQWAYPDGMSLKVPKLEARSGGSYRWEHTSKEGVFVCEGNFGAFEPGSKLEQLDNVFAPDGKQIVANQETIITFNQKPGGTFVTITQRGFPDENFLKECETAWNQCLDHLTSLFSGREERSAQSA